MLNVAQLPDGRKAIIIRTSDRITFKKCRRSWSWSSHLKRNLGPANLAGPLWFGSAVHYALEDFHGYKAFNTAADAFRAYCIATSKQHLRDLPDDAPQLFELGTKMLDYYENGWSKTRTFDETYWELDPHTGEMIPQVEVNFEIEVPLEAPENIHLKLLAESIGADAVLYRGTIDRVSIDEFGRLWVVEYKTAKIAEHLHYQTDPQVTSYMWAAQHMYPDHEVAGVVYLQFVKRMPGPPPILNSGHYSTASNLTTSANLYQDALEQMYGSVGLAPQKNREFLITLMSQEDENTDKYIQRVRIERNRAMCEAEAQKVLLELEDMLNPDLPLYPNPTRDCSRMCSFLAPCVAFDDGGDWDAMLGAKFATRDQASDRFWRRRLPNPSKLAEMRQRQIVPDLFEVQERIQKMTEEEQAAIEHGEEEIAFTFNM